ncbi:hypothetical protein BS47DRAFT_1484127 [Hydnum rufescens UP504]|uniref:Uncharacterized protein n=1 Tax=Hydnum rufescens UP504 TaxID=1448309 RepID=A0A9P6DW95_9AGAM|nr:hypothetical protein BS47DRAFT_1484127 [Hydnum rufescens UP504]
MSNEDVFDQSPEAVSRECERIVEEYRQGGVRQVAVASLAERLSTVGDFRPLATYLSMLDEHDRETGEARARGEAHTRSEGAEILATSSRDRGTNEERIGREQRPISATVTTGRRTRSESREGRADKRARPTLLERIQKRRRSRSLSSSRSDSGSSSSASAGSSGHFAWKEGVDEAGDETSQWTLSRRTHRLRAIYLSNLRQAKQSVLKQYDAPAFPESLWGDVLTNRYINLDKILSSLSGSGRD